MPSSRTPRRKGRGEVIPPSNVLDRIDALLKEHLSIFPSKTELTEGEIEHWHRDLEVYTIAAIEWAFDNWRRNGRFFPIYADILQLCDAYTPKDNLAKPECDAECKARHGKGYGQADLIKLWKLFTAKRKAVDRPLTEAEHEQVLDELDKARGQSPEWRRTA